MRTLGDCFGNQVRLTAERLAHILEHPEMSGMASEIPRVVSQPRLVRRSRSDASVRLFYEFHARTILGGKWLCVVVKYAGNDAFVAFVAAVDGGPSAVRPRWYAQ